MADFGLPHSSFLYINKTAFKKFGAIDKFLFEKLEKENNITDGAKIFFKLIERVRQFPTDKVRDISMKVLQRNAYFAHSENVVLGMLAEDDETIRRRAVDKILELLSEASATTDMESSTLEISRKDVVRQFKVPKNNVEATHFYELTNLDSIKDISQPPAVMDLDDTSIAQMLTKPLVLQHPCHNQAVERHVKLVTEAASVVTGYEISRWHDPPKDSIQAADEQI